MKYKGRNLLHVYTVTENGITKVLLLKDDTEIFRCNSKTYADNILDFINELRLKQKEPCFITDINNPIYQDKKWRKDHLE